MKFVNVRELKNKTSKVLGIAGRGEDVIVTSRGKPCVVIHHLSEDNIEEYILLQHTGSKNPKKTHKKKTIMERLSPLKEAHSFDSRFWQNQTAQARFAATWKALEEFYKIRGMDGHKLRLQRSIQNIKQA